MIESGPCHPRATPGRAICAKRPGRAPYTQRPGQTGKEPGCGHPTTLPQEHYSESERLLRVAETSVVEQIQITTALLALAHAILTLAPRRARRVERQARHAGNGNLPP